jgi:hypothetical protein
MALHPPTKVILHYYLTNQRIILLRCGGVARAVDEFSTQDKIQ